MANGTDSVAIVTTVDDVKSQQFSQVVATAQIKGSTILRPWVCFANAGTTTHTITLDYVRCWADRQP